MKETKTETPNGIFIKLTDGTHIPFSDFQSGKRQWNAALSNNVIGISIRQGDWALTVALHDEAESKYITLTTKGDKTRYKGYIDNYLDAVADWDGLANTEHLKKVGLNPEIKLSDGWYIPALGQLLFIFLNRKTINQALEFVGGTPLDNWQWCWTSTEYSAKQAWRVSLSNGTVDHFTKAATAGSVRLVSPF